VCRPCRRGRTPDMGAGWGHAVDDPVSLAASRPGSSANRNLGRVDLKLYSDVLSAGNARACRAVPRSTA